MSREPPSDADSASNDEPGIDPSDPVGGDEADFEGDSEASDRTIAVPEETDAERPFEGAFLGSIRERLAATRGGPPDVSDISIDSDVDEDDALSALTSSLPETSVEDIEQAWSTLKADIALRRSASGLGVERDRPRRVQRHQAATSLRDNFQVHVLALHGFATFVLFGIGLGIIISAATQLIAPKFWLLGLPLVLLAIAGVLPLAGWVIGFWNPQQV